MYNRSAGLYGSNNNVTNWNLFNPLQQTETTNSSPLNPTSQLPVSIETPSIIEMKNFIENNLNQLEDRESDILIEYSVTGLNTYIKAIDLSKEEDSSYQVTLDSSCSLSEKDLIFFKYIYQYILDFKNIDEVCDNIAELEDNVSSIENNNTFNHSSTHPIQIEQQQIVYQFKYAISEYRIKMDSLSNEIYALENHIQRIVKENTASTVVSEQRGLSNSPINFDPNIQVSVDSPSYFYNGRDRAAILPGNNPLTSLSVPHAYDSPLKRSREQYEIKSEIELESANRITNLLINLCRVVQGKIKKTGSGVNDLLIIYEEEQERFIVNVPLFAIAEGDHTTSHTYKIKKSEIHNDHISALLMEYFKLYITKLDQQAQLFHAILPTDETVSDYFESLRHKNINHPKIIKARTPLADYNLGCKINENAQTKLTIIQNTLVKQLQGFAVNKQRLM